MGNLCETFGDILCSKKCSRHVNATAAELSNYDRRYGVDLICLNNRTFLSIKIGNCRVIVLWSDTCDTLYFGYDCIGKSHCLLLCGSFGIYTHDGFGIGLTQMHPPLRKVYLDTVYIINL